MSRSQRCAELIHGRVTCHSQVVIGVALLPQDMQALPNGGIAAFAAKLDERYHTPPGCFMKLFDMADTYAEKLRMLKIEHQHATQNDLRYTILPPIVSDIYKDWSPQKQEYIVWAGVKTWLGQESWEGLGEHCTKQVLKGGYMSGSGDRALFGLTKEAADRECSIHEPIPWSDDEQSEDDETEDENEKQTMSSTKEKEVVIENPSDKRKRVAKSNGIRKASPRTKTTER
jgi:hypothetical protein